MSFYYEFKNCCGSKKVAAAEERHEQDCFCGKFLKRFLGEEVEIYLKDGSLIEGRIACFDKETGIVTVASAGGSDDVYLDYICCNQISRIRED